MKKYFVLAAVVASVFACGKETVNESGSQNSASPSGSCGYHNGYQLHKGPQGGCYYINSNGNKIYVDQSECQC